MRSVLSFLAVALFVLLGAQVASACDYNKRAVVVQQVVQAQVVQPVVVAPVVSQIVVPQVVSQAVVVPVVQKQVVVQQFQQVQKVRGGYGGYGGGFRQAQFVGGRQNFGGGGGGGLAGVINAVGNVANSPAGTFALGVLAGRGF